MAATLNYGSFGPKRWVDGGDGWVLADASHCTVEALGKALGGIDGLRVRSVEYSDDPTFVYTEAMAAVEDGVPGTRYEGLAPRYVVRLAVRTGDYEEHVLVWMPELWNERMMSIGGGGTRTTGGIGFDGKDTRVMSVAAAAMNGYVASMTDGGVNKPMEYDWILNSKTGAFEHELYENYVHASTHRLAGITKALCEAVYGMAPAYSYYIGASGGGRQALMEAQRHPEDYDGIWADCPAIYNNLFILADLWAPLVMKEEGCTLGVAKLDAFREYVMEECGGEDAFLAMTARPDVRAAGAIGRQTELGPITAEDARVMQMIWDGPTTPDGTRLWWGMRPGAYSWDPLTLLGVMCSDDVDPLPFFLSIKHAGQWLLEQPDWDWHALDYKQFFELWELAKVKLADLATDDPDLSKFAGFGHKLIVSHGAQDALIFPEDSIDYANQVLESVGRDVFDGFFRLFLFQEAGHGFCTFDYPSFTSADGILAISRWVEEGVVPDVAVAHTLDRKTLDLNREFELRASEL